MHANLQDGFSLGEFEVLPQQGRIIGAGNDHKVQPKIIDVLLCLASEPGEVIPRETIHDRVWGQIVVTDDALNRCVSELRRAFGDKRGNTKYIETVPKRGYRLAQSPAPLAAKPAATESPASQDAPPPLAEAIARIAVLPFENLTPDSANAFLADALPTALHSGLARLNRIRVSSRRSSFALRNSDLSIAELGNQLDAQYVVSGNVAEAGGRVRIFAEVDDADAGVLLWSHRYETVIDNVLDIEKQLTDAVVGAFGGQRLKAEINKTFANSPASLDAWQQLQHARQYLLTYNSDNLRRAKASIEAAIKTEPGYALAQAMYALLLTENVVNGLGETPDGDCETAANAADTALRIAPADPAVLRSVGCALAYLGNRQASLETLQRSVQLAPFDFGAWGYMGWPLSASSAASDAHKLLGICDRLLENAPEHPGVPYWHYHRSAALNALSQPEVALESVTACLQAQPEFALGHWQQANLYGRCGNSSAAAQAANKACRANARLDAENYKAVIYRLTNDEAAREQRLGGLKAAKLL